MEDIYSTEGITPAGAGKTRTECRKAGCARDHPRRCGENPKSGTGGIVGLGSPPQVRGKHSNICIVASTYKDHPRRCGENKKLVRTLLCSSGSPPQVRGKQSPTHGDYRAARITPAGAGKTCVRTVRQADTEDHPRRCGENNAVKVFFAVALGSPPQVRGKRFICDRSISHERITPAGAGKTGLRLLVPSSTTDHPRRCGENLRWTIQHISQSGSPPQVRGKRPHTRQKRRNIRITPAGAGKTEDYAIVRTGD